MSAHTVITIDGRIICDDPLDTWQQQAPERLAQYIRPDAQPEPWLKAAMIALAEATITNQPVRINIYTRATGWSITVDKAT